MDIFTLSRNWFNFSFENPELINPTHTAILFFAIEHCNRLGGKEKFGFPTQMSMEAIGIKKHQTYIKYLNDLVDWGFIKMIQKSTNQYSANIISLVYAMPKKGKALDKAFIKHRAKQTESTRQSKDSIYIQSNNNTNIQSYNADDDKISWRQSFEIYKKELDLVYQKLLNDETYIKKQEKFHTGIDIKLSLERAYSNFWSTEAGWIYKKKKKSKDINWKNTLTNAIDMNKVWMPRNNTYSHDNGLFTQEEALIWLQKNIPAPWKVSNHFEFTNNLTTGGKKLLKRKSKSLMNVIN